jgi:PAS domain S-box-containing protein
MSDNSATPGQELEQLRARVAALEQLHEAHERTAVDQAERLEQSLDELRARAKEQASTEARLRNQSGILQSILNSMGDGVAVVDASGRFLHFNAAAEQILGMGPKGAGPDEWVANYGFYLPDMVTPYAGKQLPLARAMRGEAVNGAEIFVRNPRVPDGLWMSVNSRPLRDEAGIVRGGITVFRDITATVRAARRRAAQHAVTSVLAESDTTAEAVPRILQTICQEVGWKLGAVWNLDRRADVLRCVDVWHVPAAEFAEFVDLTRTTTFARGLGLPGRVWASRQPVWITDIPTDLNFPRTGAAKCCGLHSAFGFPILSGGEVTGALEFFSPEIRQPDDDLLAMIGTLGAQIGQFLERKRAEEELRGQRERFEVCVRGSGDGVWDWEIESKTFYYSPRWKSMLGYEDHEIANVYEEWEKRLHPDDRERALAAIRDYFGNRTPVYELEHRLRHKDGTYRWILARGVALRDPNGRPYRMAGSQTDITERKRMEEALRNEEALYHSLVETLPLSLLRKDLRGRFTFANQRFCDTLGRPREEILGKTDYDFYPAATARKYCRDDRRVIDTGELFEDVEENYRPDGAKTYVQVLKSPVRDARGEVVGVQGMFWDVTARKEAEQRLHEAMEAAEAANRAKSLFLASMSHEIRTPMNAVIGMTELVLETPIAPEARACLETVRKSADHLLTVINDILDFSKIEAGKLDIDQKEFRLRDTVGDAVSTLALRAHQQGLELACRIPSGVPEGLIGDPGRLRQVLVNLVGNAIKFTERGEVVVRVAVAEQTEESVLLHFEVTDTGIGIPAEKLKTIFAPFTQVDGSLTRRRGGTGLGLAISRRLVEMMGGSVGVDSEPDKGSRFHFTIRCGTAVTAVTPAAEPARVRGLPVLVVDDNATNRFILEEMLTGWRMRPSTVDSGQAALKALRGAVAVGEPFPLVLLDAHMPGMDGFTVAELIQQDPQLDGTRVVMLTSGSQPGTTARRRALGLAACLPKPVKQAELWKAIVAALSEPTEVSATSATQRDVAEVSATSAARRCYRILVAEDNPINQNLAVRLLEKQGHRVVLAANGKEAIAALERQPFDLVLMDLQMPELDGLEATALIRDREKRLRNQPGGCPRVPIIAMTAYAMKGDRERCLEAGMDGYVSKPVRARELFEAIDSIGAGPGRAGAWSADDLLASDDADGDDIDWTAALEYVGGDRKMLRDLVAIFLDEYPRWLDELRQAIRARDLPVIKRVAHNFKGSMRLLGARPVQEAAFVLDLKARDGNLSEADQAAAALEAGIECLKPALVRAAAQESGVRNQESGIRCQPESSTPDS